jgi:hypothetical protein
MPRYLVLALNGPTLGEGDEEEYNRLYDEVHLPDIAEVDGIKVARRYKVLRSSYPQEHATPYFAAYEIETDNLDQVFTDMSTNPRPFSPVLDLSRSQNIVAIELNAVSIPDSTPSGTATEN